VLVKGTSAELPFGATVSSAGMELVPGRLWSLWDIMKAFNAALLGHAFRQMTVYEERALASGDSPNDEATQKEKEDVDLTLAASHVIAGFIKLEETKDAIDRLKIGLRNTAEPMTRVGLKFALHHLLQLMGNELDKRKVFAIDAEKAKYYQDDIFGVEPSASGDENVAVMERIGQLRQASVTAC
jgi:hypothetical protein